MVLEEFEASGIFIEVYLLSWRVFFKDKN